MPRTVIGHRDTDCSHVSAERVRYGHRAGQPVGVLGYQGACVIAKSSEMKATRVKTTTPIREESRLCPEMLAINRDFRYYEVLSRIMLDRVRELSPRVEYDSIGEFFFVAIPPHGMDHQAYALAIRDRILERVPVRVTVGPARSRTLAKLICDSAERAAAVERVVNARRGRFALRWAATRPPSGVNNDSANQYDICDVRGKTCF